MKGQDKQNLRYYQGDSPASPFPLSDTERALQTPVTSGRKCAASLTSCAPISCLAKMLLTSSIWGCTKRSLTWNRRDMPSGHSYFLLVPSVRGMNANGHSSSGLMFHTPLASDTGTKPKTQRICLTPAGSFRRKRKDGGYWAAALSEIIYFLEPEAPPSYRFNPEWVEWLMGFPQGWTDISFGT